MLFAFGVAAPSASGAVFEIVPGSFAVRALDAAGDQEARAGSHPDRLQIDFGLNSEGTSAQDFAFEMPAGLNGAPGSVPPCPRELYEKGEEECPAESQVGTIAFKLSAGGEATFPIYQLEPAPGEIIAFGSIAGFEAVLTMELRPDDLGLTFTAGNLPEVAVSGGRIELWGVPADHQSGTSILRRPFLTLPRRCGAMDFGFRARSREPDAPWLSASAQAESLLGGCQDLAFEPKLGLQLGNSRADSPTGVRIDLGMPEDNDPDQLASAQIRNATIELPEGLTLSPSGAAGIAVCSEAQLGLGKATSASCPPSSRIGAMELASPLAPEPLVGDVYLGEASPEERLRMFVVASGPGGIVVKSTGAMRIDPATGRLSSVLRNLPQLPLDRLTLSIDGGPGALLASPLTCGSFPAVATLDSYSGGAPAKALASVTVGASADGSACLSPAAFSPRLVASSSVHAAGRPTAISMTLLRRPGEQLTRRFAVSLPKGLSPGLAGVELCPDAAAASGACPAGSRIGTAVAEVGAGFSPVALRGAVYSAGAYRGAPSSLVLALDAAIGPFELGTMATRAAMRFDLRTGRATVVTDPLPGLVEGIPVRIQAIGMSLDRPGAFRNPTSCAAASFDATVEAASGAMATASSALPVTGCRKLALKPRFAMSLSGSAELHEDGNPGFRLTTRLRRGDANLRALRMSLPAALTFDVSGLGEICPRGDARDGLCSARARVGTAVAQTSLLSSPLRGSVYVVAPPDNGPPDLAVSIAANGVQVGLSGRMSLRHGRLGTNLVGLPDMPLSRLTMRFRGGERGVLSLRSTPCPHGRDLTSRLSAEGQNGTRIARRVRVKAHCGKTAPGGAAAGGHPSPRPTATR
ncbi:MAG TPA: hypothetical protein VN756_06420 [Solirubrobacterales bacterium]|nr:hypothetical protein [Solirubrobacterales bacterium]